MNDSNTATLIIPIIALCVNMAVLYSVIGSERRARWRRLVQRWYRRYIAQVECECGGTFLPLPAATTPTETVERCTHCFKVRMTGFWQ